MASNVTRMPQQQIVDPASGWWWNGSQWVCGDCDDSTQPCPPNPFPPVFSGPAMQPPWYPGANGGVSFGTVAPPNPVRGHFWWDGVALWIFDGAAWVDTNTGAVFPGGGGGGSGSGQGTVIISTQPPGNPSTGAQWWDGTVLRVWDGTKWNIVGPGATAGPVPTTTHTFRITQSTTVAVPVNTWAIAPFTVAPQIDPQLSFDSTTKKITPTKAGVYLWFIRAFLGTGVPTGAFGVALTRNDQGTFTGNTEAVALSSIGSFNSPVNEWLSAGGISIMNGTTDFVRMYIYSGDPNGMYGSPWPNIDAYLLP